MTPHDINIAPPYKRRGVLVAISIPIFTEQLEKRRDAVSIANIRAAYAMAQADYLTSDGKTTAPEDNVEIKYNNGKVETITVKNVAIKSEKKNDWSGLGKDLPWVASTATTATPEDTGVAADNKSVVFTYGTDGKITTVAFGS